MSIYAYEQAFGAADKTSRAMRKAIREWFSLYYDGEATQTCDPCQRIACTVVTKLIRTVFGEYRTQAPDPVVQELIRELDRQRRQAMQLTLIGGESYLKPCPGRKGFRFALIPRNNVLIFGRNHRGEPTDVGTVERSCLGKFYYTLLERRTVDDEGYLTLENRLFRSGNDRDLGTPVELKTHPAYGDLADCYRFSKPLHSLGLVRLKNPTVNCVDGSPDGVSVYAPAVGLIRNIDRNEAQLNGEFSRGESRILLSADLLGREGLEEHLFVGLDDDPEHTGITVFAPQLREQAFLARKQEYLRNVESLIGLQRGMLSDANVEDRTATEIAASAAAYSLTVIELQGIWEQALTETISLCAALAELYRLPVPKTLELSVDWGNGVLYDEDKKWTGWMELVDRGLIRPELALGWRFKLPTDTPEQLAAIRQRLMPEQKNKEES